MALFMRQQGPRSELQEKVAAELQEKLRQQHPTGEQADLGKAHDYDSQQTTRPAGVIITILLVLLVVAVVFYVR